MEKARMLGMEQGVVGGTEGGRSPTGVPPTTPAAAAPGGPVGGNGTAIPDPAVSEKPVRRRFTAEYSIRTFLDAHTQRTLAQLREWASDPDMHVRRLVSEGTRPRLPWWAWLTPLGWPPAWRAPKLPVTGETAAFW